MPSWGAALIDESLRPWRAPSSSAARAAGIGPTVVYAAHDRLYLSATAEQAGLTLSYFSHLQHLRLRVKLPDMAIPLNPVCSLA